MFFVMFLYIPLLWKNKRVKGEDNNVTLNNHRTDNFKYIIIHNLLGNHLFFILTNFKLIISVIKSTFFYLSRSPVFLDQRSFVCSLFVTYFPARPAITTITLFVYFCIWLKSTHNV